MNSDMMKSRWRQLKGEVRVRWSKLTEDDLGEIRGNPDVLLGKIQEHYGRTREEAEEEMDEWLTSHRPAKREQPVS